MGSGLDPGVKQIHLMDEQETTSNISAGVEQTADIALSGVNDEAPSKMEDNGRNPDGTFKEGHKGGPGRPKGMSMKEFARQRFKWMDYDEKKAFIDALPPDIVWRMAEGNPAQDSKQEVSGSLTIEISEKIASKNKLYEAD